MRLGKVRFCDSTIEHRVIGTRQFGLIFEPSNFGAIGSSDRVLYQLPNVITLGHKETDNSYWKKKLKNVIWKQRLEISTQ